MVGRTLVVFCVAAMLALACSGSSGGDGGTGYVPNPALCEATCKAMLASGCGSGTPAECQAECEATREKYSPCLAEVDALFTCGGDKGYVCGPTGVVAPSCGAETKNLSMCGACIPTGSNGPCTICAKKACCAEYKAFGAAADLESYKTCIESCATPACLDACNAANPVAGQAFQAVESCRSTRCPTSCDGKPSDLPSDPAGRMCAAAAKAGCPIADCESSYTYGSDPTGCGPEMFSAMECAASKPVSCKDGSPVFDEACTKAYMECVNGGTGGGTATNSGGSGGSGGAMVGGSGGA